IKPGIQKVADGELRVTFGCNEVRRITIDKVVITGNQGLTAKQIKAVMETQERQYFILRGTVQRQKLEDYIERILALYNNHGFIQARVESHDITVDRKTARVTITLKVVEGPQLKAKSLDSTGKR